MTRQLKVQQDPLARGPRVRCRRGRGGVCGRRVQVNAVGPNGGAEPASASIQHGSKLRWLRKRNLNSGVGRSPTGKTPAWTGARPSSSRSASMWAPSAHQAGHRGRRADPGLRQHAHRLRQPEQRAAMRSRFALEAVDMPEDRMNCCIGTGYGRVNVPFANRTLTEIACHARGANFIYGPEVRTVLDVGGQDIKSIQCDEKGKVTNFLIGAVDSVCSRLFNLSNT
ncbi:MAG: hypothetical protein MZV70_10990 [Desulfobacterales bacterium]|nr:hypothetical protein [Desulfobacterales bacterium]